MQHFPTQPAGYIYYQTNQRPQQNAGVHYYQPNQQGQHHAAVPPTVAQPQNGAGAIQMVPTSHVPAKQTKPKASQENGQKQGLQLEPAADLLATGSNTTGYFDTGGRIGALCSLLTKVHKEVHDKFGCCLWHVHEGLHSLAIQKNVDFKLTTCTSPERQGAEGELYRWQPRSCTAEDWLSKALLSKGGAVVVNVQHSTLASSAPSSAYLPSRTGSSECTGQCAAAVNAATALEEAQGQVKELSQQLVQAKVQARTAAKDAQLAREEAEQRVAEVSGTKQQAAANQAESFLRQIDELKKQLADANADAQRAAGEHAVQVQGLVQEQQQLQQQLQQQQAQQRRAPEGEARELAEKLRGVGEDCLLAEKEAETAIAASRATCAKLRAVADLIAAAAASHRDADRRLSAPSPPHTSVQGFPTPRAEPLFGAGSADAISAAAAQALTLATQAADAAEKSCSILLGASIKVPRPSPPAPSPALNALPSPSSAFPAASPGAPPDRPASVGSAVSRESAGSAPSLAASAAASAAATASAVPPVSIHALGPSPAASSSGSRPGSLANSLAPAAQAPPLAASTRGPSASAAASTAAASSPRGSYSSGGQGLHKGADPHGGGPVTSESQMRALVAQGAGPSYAHPPPARSASPSPGLGPSVSGSSPAPPLLSRSSTSASPTLGPIALGQSHGQAAPRVASRSVSREATSPVLSSIPAAGSNPFGHANPSSMPVAGSNHFGQARPSWDRNAAAQPSAQPTATPAVPATSNSIYHPSAARRVLDRVATVVGSRPAGGSQGGALGSAGVRR